MNVSGDGLWTQKSKKRNEDDDELLLLASNCRYQLLAHISFGSRSLKGTKISEMNFFFFTSWTYDMPKPEKKFMAKHHWQYLRIRFTNKTWTRLLQPYNVAVWDEKNEKKNVACVGESRNIQITVFLYKKNQTSSFVFGRERRVRTLVFLLWLSSEKRAH